MKYSVVADNYTVNFREEDNILCLEGYFTAKNIEQLLGTVPQNSKVVGIHIKGNNSSATPNIILSGQVKDNGSAANVVIGAYASAWGQLSNVPLTGNINWFFSNYVLATQYTLNDIRLKIDNASFFTGYLYIRVFLKMK